MAARRKRYRRGRRGRTGGLYKLLSVLLVAAAIVVGCAVFFRVDRIEVEGAADYTAEQVITAAGVERGDNLFLINKIQVARQILGRLPYVDEVSISRRLPDTLVITVGECVPMAVIQGEGAWWILDERTKLLERTDFSGAGGYPVVTGLTMVAPGVGMRLSVPEEQSMKLRSFQALLSALRERKMEGGAESYDLTADNVIEMRYGGRFTVRISMACEDFSRAMHIVEAAQAQLPETASGVLDLTINENEAHLIPYS